MATDSTVVYVSQSVGALGVIPMYKEFMKASTGVGSVYLRAK